MSPSFTKGFHDSSRYYQDTFQWQFSACLSPFLPFFFQLLLFVIPCWSHHRFPWQFSAAQLHKERLLDWNSGTQSPLQEGICIAGPSRGQTPGLRFYIQTVVELYGVVLWFHRSCKRIKGYLASDLVYSSTTALFPEVAIPLLEAADV